MICINRDRLGMDAKGEIIHSTLIRSRVGAIVSRRSAVSGG